MSQRATITVPFSELTVVEPPKAAAPLVVPVSELKVIQPDPVTMPAAATAGMLPPSTVDPNEQRFRTWYGDMARRYDLNPDPDSPDQFYDYRAAFKAGAKPDTSGHWPSDYKKAGHPTLVVGGFHVQTGARVPGTPRAKDAAELVKLGWDAETAKKLAAVPEPAPVEPAAATRGMLPPTVPGQPMIGPSKPRTVGQRLEDVARAPVAGALRFNTSFWGWLEAAGDVLGMESVRDYAKALGNQASEMSTKARGPQAGAGPTEQAILSGFESLGIAVPSLLAGVAAGAASANPAVGTRVSLGLMGAQTGGEAYSDAREKGAGVAQSIAHATSQGAIEVATEMIPASRLLDDLAKRTGLFQLVTRQLASEIPGEQVATALQDLNDWATLNPDEPFSTYIESRPGAAAHTLVATIVGTLGQTAGVAAGDRVMRYVDEQLAARQSVPPEGGTQDAPTPAEPLTVPVSEIEPVEAPAAPAPQPTVDVAPVAAATPVSEVGTPVAPIAAVRPAGDQAPILYHGTDVDFDSFERSEDIGFHFGSKETAQKRIESGEMDDGRVVAATVNVRNPLRLRDLHTWSPKNVLSALVDAGIITDEQADEIDLVDRETIAPLLEAKGYDGIVYENETEGGGDSVIALRPEQVAIVGREPYARPQKAAEPITVPVSEIAPVDEPPAKHKFSSTQVNLPAAAATKIQALAAKIPDEDISEHGRETEPHITVKYGLTTSDAEKVREVLKDEPPVTVTFGATSHFADVEDGTADAVKVDIDSADLRRLNAKIAEALDTPGDTHPSYKPHATVAYVKPGLGTKYDGDETLKGQEVTLDRIVFSSKTGEQIEIPLTGKAAAAGGPTVTRNTSLNSIEVAFPQKPDPEVLSKLKAAGYKWAKGNKVWYRRLKNASETLEGNEARVRQMLGIETKAAAPEPKPAVRAAPPPVAETKQPERDTPAVQFKKGDTVEYRDFDGKWHQTEVVDDTRDDGTTGVWHPTMRMQPMWPPGATPSRTKVSARPDEIRAVGAQPAETAAAEEQTPAQKLAAKVMARVAAEQKEKKPPTPQVDAIPGTAVRLPSFATAQYTKKKREPVGTISDGPPAPKPKKAKAEPSDWTEIGKNAIGHTLYEDQRGIRSYIVNGVRHTEPVAMKISRAGVIPTPADRSGSTEWNLAADKPKAQRVYHGSAEIARRGTFEGFRLDIAPHGATRVPESTMDAIGTWFTASKSDALTYSRYIDEDGTTRKAGAVIEADVTLNNPRVFESSDAFREWSDTFREQQQGGGRSAPSGGKAKAALVAAGYDGIIVRNGGRGDATPDGADFYVAFDPAAVAVVGSEIPTKSADLDARKAANEAKRQELFAKLRGKLTANIDPDDVVTMAEILLTYVDDGITEFRRAWRQFKLDAPDLAESLRRHFEVAWEEVRGEAVSVAEVEEEAQNEPDGTAPADVRPDAGQLPERGAGAARPGGTRRESALGAVPAGEGEGAPRAGRREGARDGDSSGVVAAGVSDDARGGAHPDTAPSPSAGGISGAALSPTGTTGDPGARPGDYGLTGARIRGIIDRGAAQRLRDNIAAIRIVKDLQAQQRFATAEEQETLAKYVGWGDNALAQFLAAEEKWDWSGPQKTAWRELQELTTEDERKSLIRSSPNAHFTFDLYEPIWAALDNAGFVGGRVLEPAVGSGHAFGFMPADVRAASTLTAVELDPFTATIAQALYPSARVQAVGYEKARVARGTQDLVISNVPFGDFGVTDNRFPNHVTGSIHNYFFARALEHVRPGGLVVFVTSRKTLDGPAHTRTRQYLAERAHFLGAIRLPDTAFDKTAKTSVVTDLIVLQRIREGETPRNSDLFVESPKSDALSTVEVRGYGRRAKRENVNVYRSKWYDAHPELILGTESLEGKMQDPYTVTATAPDIGKAIYDGLTTILPPGTYLRATTEAAAEETSLGVAEGRFNVGEYRVGEKGRLVRVIDRDGNLAPAMPMRGDKADEGTAKRIVGMIGIRDALRATVRAMRTDAPAKEIQAAQKALNKAYQSFVKEHGPLNSRANKRAFEKDSDAANLLGLEHTKVTATEKVKNGKRTLVAHITVTGLNDIFTKRTIHAEAEIDRAETPQDALLASLSSRVAVDWAYMARITGQTEHALQRALLGDGRVFEVPDGTWAIRDEYLSGDVVTKLADAEAAAEQEPERYARNVEALKAIQPKLRTAADVQIAFSAHWVPPDYRAEFVAKELGVNPRHVTIRHDQTLTYSRWTLQIANSGRSETHPLAVPYGREYGNGQKSHLYSFIEMVDDALNLRMPSLKWTEGSGDDKVTLTDAQATLAAQANIEELERQWMTWVYADPDRTATLLKIYNERLNRTVPRVYDGSHLANIVEWDPETKTGKRTAALPGLALPFPLHPHQTRGVWRALVSGNTLLAHDVGAGKTFEMIVTAMEWRRLGRARKPMITVPTYLLGQWREDVIKAYPAAKVLAFTEDDLIGKKRQQAMARIAFGDWDIVLVPHSSFELLAVSDGRMAQMLQAMLDEIVGAEAEARDRDGDDDPSVKQLERRRRQIEDKLQAKLDAQKSAAASKALTWEDLGVDGLIVDEAQSFKNLYFHTNITGLRGLSASEADKSLDLYIKIQDINEASNYRNVVFGTATPVMNSLAEAFTMQRYLQPAKLREAGLHHFDNWYAAFARVEVAPEQQPDGSYKDVRRLKEFRNLRTLHQMFSEVMDYVSRADMPYLKLPKLEGGKVRLVNTPQHPQYQVVKNWFTRRLDELRNNPPWYDFRRRVYHAPDRVHPISGVAFAKDNILTVMRDARLAAIDLRLVLGPQYVDDFAQSRIQQAASDMVDWYKGERARKGVTLVFLDAGIPAPSDLKPLAFLKGVASESEGFEEAGVDDDPVEAGTVVGADLDTGSFNLYDAIRDALITRGVPAREIAYIHQARNPAERLALFQAARNGDVRFVLASTDKGGVGMSIQDRLGHMVEVDVPRYARPGDVHQRNGRIIRQGNMYETVRLSRYVTQGTTDEYTYGLITKKAVGIDQFMRGEADTFTDEDPLNKSIEEAQILATGDPRGVELIKLRSETQRLEAQASSVERNVAQARGKRQQSEQRLAYKEREYATFTEWEKGNFANLRGDKFTMEVGGVTYTERAEANKALIDKAKGVLDGRSLNDVVRIGTIGTLPVGVQYIEDRYGRGGVAFQIDADAASLGTLFGLRVDAPKPAAKGEPQEAFGEGSNVVASLTRIYDGIPALGDRMKDGIREYKADIAEADRQLEEAATNDVVEKYKASKARFDELAALLAAETKAAEAVRDAAEKARAEAERQATAGAQSLTEKLDDIEDAAKQRIKGKLGNITSGVDPTIMADLIVVGATKVAKGTVRFAEWSAEMVREFGETIRPYLHDIYAKAVLKVEEFGPLPITATSERDIPPATPIPEDRLYEFPSIHKMPDAIREDIAALLQQYRGFEAQRREVQSWARTKELAKDVWLPLETLKPGRALNAEELNAYQTAIATALTRRKPLLDKVAKGEATDVEKLEISHLTDVATVLTASYRGAKAEAGRALNILRSKARVLELQESRFLEAALAAPGFQKDITQLSKEALAVAGDPLKQLQLLRKRSGTWYDALQAVYYANLLSGIKTHLRNAIGNSANVLANLVTPFGAVPADMVRAKRTGAKREVFLGEIPEALRGTLIGFNTGLANAAFTFREGFRPKTVQAAGEGKFDTPRFELRGGLLNPFNYPSRMLESADEFFRAIAYHQELYAGAYAQARREKAKDVHARMAEILAGADEQDFRARERLIEAAERYAARAVFQEETGPLVRLLLKAKEPGMPLPVRAAALFVAPFIKTPAAILRQGFEWSPAGFVMRGSRERGRAGAQALGRAALGTAFMLGPMAWLAATGRLTGAPPDDPGEREEFYALGKLANAVKIGQYWVRYVLFQPYSVMMSAVANAWQKFDKSEQDDAAAEEAFAAAVAGAGASLMDQSFLAGLGTVIDAINDPERYAGQWLNLFSQGFVPLSGLSRNVTQAVDPMIRKPEGVKESVQTIVPGLSDNVLPRRNRFGEAVTRPGPWWQRGFVVPEVSKAVDDELVLTMAAVGYRPTTPRAELTRNGQRVTLTREQQDAIAEALGVERRIALEATMRNPVFASRADEVKREMFERDAAEASSGVRARALRALGQNQELTLERLLSGRALGQIREDRREVLGSMEGAARVGSR